MKKLCVRLICPILLALACFIVPLFSSCARPLKISDEEALAVLKDLVPKSYDINVIFFGSGLPVTDEIEKGDSDSAKYIDVKNDCGYSSIDDIKAAAEKIYSLRYLEGIYVGAFKGITAESSDGALDMSVSPRYKEIGGRLMFYVFSDVKKICGKLSVISAEVKKKTPKYVIVSAAVSENGVESVRSFYLTVENGVWLLDSPTY